MTEKKISSKTSKLKSFLVTGFAEDKESKADEEEASQYEAIIQEGPPEQEEVPAEEVVIEDIIVEEVVFSETEIEYEPARLPAPAADTSRLEEEIAQLKAMVAELTSEMGKYTTSREQLKEYSAVMNRRDAELANRKFMGMLEQLSVMREDFFKLCKGIDAKLNDFSPRDILSSFEAYGVDMENILVDCGVQIGPSKFERLNTTHQRIIGVVPADDESMNGMIAERASDGYVYQGRVLLKEKVKIYKFSENGKTEGDGEK